MRQSNFTYLWHIVKQLLVVMGLMTICRLLFYFCNTSLYSELTLRMIIGGLRFDAVVVVLANGLFILSGLLPFSYRFTCWYFKTYRALFVVLNGLLLTFNLIDVAYVGFTKKRSSIDLFTTQGLGNDAAKLAPQFAADYWYLLLTLVVFLWVLYKVIKPFQFQKTGKLIEGIILLFVLGFCVLIQRGGLQAKPLLVIHANQYTTSDHNFPTFSSDLHSCGFVGFYRILIDEWAHVVLFIKGIPNGNLLIGMYQFRFHGFKLTLMYEQSSG